MTTMVISQWLKRAETALEERRNGAKTADAKRRRAERFGIPAGTSTNYNIHPNDGKTKEYIISRTKCHSPKCSENKIIANTSMN